MFPHTAACQVQFLSKTLGFPLDLKLKFGGFEQSLAAQYSVCMTGSPARQVLFNAKTRIHNISPIHQPSQTDTNFHKIQYFLILSGEVTHSERQPTLHLGHLIPHELQVAARESFHLKCSCKKKKDAYPCHASSAPNAPCLSYKCVEQPDNKSRYRSADVN